MSDLLIWPIVTPLAAALLALLWPARATPIGIAAAALTLLSTLRVAWQVSRDGVLELALGGWSPGLGIALRADGLSAVLLAMSGRTLSTDQVLREFSDAARFVLQRRIANNPRDRRWQRGWMRRVETYRRPLP